MRPITPSTDRVPLATRVAVSTAITAGVGWAAGDLSAGLIAVLGVFTADYGTDRPIFNRGVQSAVVAVSLAVVVTLGSWASTLTWLGIAAVSTVAVAAVWLCSALGVGPPGAYMFVLVCAAGTGVSASHLRPWQVGLLVLGGGTTAWVAEMIAAWRDPRGPEQKAVSAAGVAVSAYLRAVDTTEAAAARHRAAAALSRSWETLVDHQRGTRRPAGDLSRLRDANHALHVMFADAIAGRPVPGGADTARAIGALEADPAGVLGTDRNRPPLPSPALPARLAAAVRRGSHSRRVMMRVALATPLAGALASGFGVGHAYWAMAGAVLVLHQGSHLVATLQRGIDRVAGTLVGLGLAAVVLLAHPQGWWLIAIVVTLQFCIEMFVVANYAVATVFITAIALSISAGTRRVDIGALILDRGLDTVIGCGVGLTVYLLMSRRQESRRIHAEISGVLGHIITVTGFLADGTPRSLAARAARRALQDSIFGLETALDAARNGSRGDRAAAARLAAVAAATEHLGYATIAASWNAEQGGPSLSLPGDSDSYLTMLRLLHEVRKLQEVRKPSDVPPAGEDLPAFAAPDVRALLEAVRAQSAP